MSHLDEGTLHALLDGELDPAERHQIQAHLDHCAACGTRLDDVKSVRNEADRLIVSLGSVDVTAAAPKKAPPPLADASTGPVLLIPDQPDSELRRERRHRMLNWAAGLFVAAGVGYLALDIRSRQQLAALATSETEQPERVPESALASDNPPVLSPTESMGHDSTSTTPAPSSDQAPGADTIGDATSTAESRELQALRRRDATSRPETPQAEAAAELAKIEKARGGATAAQDRNQKSLTLGDRTARELRSATATADLDRARRKEEQLAADRAVAERAATAQAIADRVAAAALPPAPAPAPPPPSLEQRAQIYLRIGLDEAKRQLGTPMHVIEGMTPTLVGLAQGRVAAGMDSTRPVVRAVYLDASSRLIILDQQRLRPGQSAGAATQLRLAIDDVIVQLHGEPGVNVLRNLAARIQ